MVGHLSVPQRSLRATLVRGMGEWFFALFLFAGYYKADPRCAFIQTHVDITVLFLILSFLSFLQRAIRDRFAQRIPSRFTNVAALFLFLAAWLFVGLFYTQSREYGLEKALRFIVLTGWAFFGAALLIPDFPSLKRFSLAIVAISMAMGVDAVLGYPGVGQVGFVTAFGSNYIALARAAGFGLLMTVGLLLPTEQRPSVKLALWGVAILQLWAALSAGARGPVLVLIFSILLSFALSVRGFPRLRIERFALRLGVIVFFVFAALAVVGQELFSGLLFRTQIALTEGGTSVMTRLILYQAAIQLWSNSPIWGNGTGQFGIAVAGEDIRLYPHNIILELGAENGLIGVLLLVTITGMALAKPLVTLGTQRGLAKTTTRCLLVVCCFTLLNAMVSGDLNDNRMLFTCIALVAMVYRFQKSASENHSIYHNVRASQTRALSGGV